MNDLGSKKFDPDELVIDPVNERVSNTGFHSEQDEAFLKSIRENGVLNPIVVREVDGEYRVVAGQRRTLAAQQVGLDEIRANIRDLDDKEARLLSITENADEYQKDVPPGDRAKTIKKLIDDGVDISQIARQMGCSQPTVERWLEPARDYWEDTEFEPDPDQEEEEEEESLLDELSLTSMRLIREATDGSDQAEKIAKKIIKNNVKVELVREAHSVADTPIEFGEEISKIIEKLNSNVQTINEKITFSGDEAEKLDEVMKDRGVHEREAIKMLVRERLKKISSSKDGELIEFHLPKGPSEKAKELTSGSDVSVNVLCRKIVEDRLN
ncbi:ParB/RepB/Spo0J family partition protein [Halorhabdus rudnickae]|uniref:ParB/RepB/Spo0J family partition protein n=1 Tax=Halorhabdus rudnickae TaxID=1775544 RepID=UPI001082F4C6|nr:ParB/RepB/Spo0J family partition protein [Halorhabdus rudnickae]